MSRFARIASTSIGKKLLMAVTGLGMAAWLIAHLTGNLKIFLGQKEMNEYALWLHDHPSLLWPTRLAMLAFVLLHIRKGLQLTSENRKARPSKYQVERTLRAGFPSLHMAMSGIVLVMFIAMHLAHYTFHILPGEYRNDAMGNPDVYAMMISGFKDPLFSGVYVIALGFAGLHLWHALSSALQTLGINHAAYNQLLRNGLKALVIVLVLGFWSMPISVFLHFNNIVQLPIPAWN
mgnify:FL=1